MMNNRAPRQILWLLPLLFSSLPASSQLSQLAAGVAGPQQSLADGRLDTSPRTIWGTVVDSVTGEPIYRALVQIGGQYAALTDHEGRFEFDGVVSNGVPAWTMKPGYFADKHPNSPLPGSPLSGPPSNDAQASNGLSAGQPQSITLKLVPEAILSGVVTGPDGAALEGVPVRLKTLAVSEGGLLRWRPGNATTTNSEGRYRFAELEAGRYAVTSDFHLEGLPGAHTSLAYVPARNPPIAVSSGSEQEAARAEGALVLAPGDHREANLTPEVEKLYDVSGVVAGGSNQGVSFRVVTASGEDVAPASRFDTRTGEFHLMLPGGTYQLNITSYLQQGAVEARRELVVPQAPVRGIVCTMEPYATIPVLIEAETVNQPASGTAQQPPSAQPYLFNLDPSSAAQPLIAGPLKHSDSSTVPSGIGPREINNIPPGHYLFGAYYDSPWYVSSASCGNIDLLREDLVVAGGEAGCSMRVLLRNDSGSLHVTLREDAENSSSPRTRPAVYALPLGDSARHQLMLQPNGRDFAVEGVAPGRYLILALDHPQEIPYRDAPTMRGYASQGQEVTVAPGGSATAEVSVIRQEP